MVETSYGQCVSFSIDHQLTMSNEYSARYSVMPDKFYRPEQVKLQSTTNNQGGDAHADELTSDQFMEYIDHANDGHKEYMDLINKGVSREQARMGLPVNVYTEFFWCANLHNAFNFLRLRMDGDHAQYEIKVYADAMFELIKKLCPVACEAFEDYVIRSIKLSKLEVDFISGKIPELTNKRERVELDEKLKLLGRLNQ